jgi:hypothetical protein
MKKQRFPKRWLGHAAPSFPMSGADRTESQINKTPNPKSM